MGTQDKASNKLQDVKGKVKETVGKATGDGASPARSTERTSQMSRRWVRVMVSRHSGSTRTRMAWSTTARSSAMTQIGAQPRRAGEFSPTGRVAAGGKASAPSPGVACDPTSGFEE